MCDVANRLRLALYAASLQVSGAANPANLKEIGRERQGQAYSQALAALRLHLQEHGCSVLRQTEPPPKELYKE